MDIDDYVTNTQHLIILNSYMQVAPCWQKSSEARKKLSSPPFAIVT